MKRILASFFFLVFHSELLAMNFDQEHKIFNHVLKQYLNSEHFVYYKKLKADIKDAKHPFNQYLTEIRKVSFKEWNSWSKNDQMAFLINSYNALTMELILENYPLESIKDIGFLWMNAWKKDFFKLLDGKMTNLDTIEHKYLRANYHDYRIHAAVNCASISCPVLRKEAYRGKDLDQQLDEQMKTWLGDLRRNDCKKNKFSMIFKWYREDFEKEGPGISAVLKKFTSCENLPQKVDYLDYNWQLNEAKD